MPMSGDEFEASVLDATADAPVEPAAGHNDYDEHEHDETGDGASHERENESAQEAGQSAGSRSDFDHEEDDHEDDHDDVFSEHSPRSSLSGSLGTGSAEDKLGDDGACHERLPRLSDISTISGFARVGGGPRLSDLTEAISHMSQYEIDLDEDRNLSADEDGGVETRRGRMPSTSIHGTPRAAFRTPSAVRAMQMSSPTSTSPPIIYGGSPRSVRQRRRQLQEEEQRGRRDSSASARQTPTRFRVIRSDPAPLVLLHATLMPARWTWGPVLDRWILEEDAAEHGCDEQSDMPNTLRQLHAAWCQLQSIMGGDTVTERGVLLPHPQDDYEVLEERLLEALELPMRRRARILECGHYLGPEDDDGSSTNSEDDYDRDRDIDEDSRHWCTTCRAEIRYEPLGAERVYRVKVYASNGLMTVGAWSACWREMERVDVEIEPILLDASVVRELTRLRAAQVDKDRERQMRGIVVAVAPSPSDLPVEDHFRLQSSPSASPSANPAAVNDSASDEWRRREAEERLREIYGTAAAADAEAMQSEDARDDHAFGTQSPPSPSAEAYERREERRRQASQSAYPSPTSSGSTTPAGVGPHGYETASFGELLLAAGKVFLRDHRHVAIIVLSALVILLVALRPAETTVVMMPAMQAMPGNAMMPAGTHAAATRAVAASGTEIPSIAIQSAVWEPAAAAGDECAAAEGDSAFAVVDALAAMMDVDMDVDGLDMDECFFGEESLPALDDRLTVDSGTVVEVETETVTQRKTVRVYETVTETATKTMRMEAASASASTSGSAMVAAGVKAAAVAGTKQRACVEARMPPELDMVAHDPDAPAQLAAAERVQCGRA